jgi:hypothetical protein
MPIPERLSVWAYDPLSGAVTNYGDQIEQLRFTTLAAGGFGNLSGRLKVRDASLVPAELRAFSRVLATDGSAVAFAGRWDAPAITLGDPSEGDVFDLQAMGGAHSLDDDPDDYSYSGQTALQIISNQISARSAYIAIDTDTSAILPTNPADTYNEAFAGKSFAEVLNTVLGKAASIFDWQVWDHPTHRDANGFPTWQLNVGLRDTTTVDYTAQIEDLSVGSGSTDIEHTYNAVELIYRDATTLVPTKLLVKDSRLNANKSQGNAPYPFRKFRIDKSNLTLSSAQASSLANLQLTQFQNGWGRHAFRVTSVRDANGNLIPLWQVRAGNNVFAPAYALAGNTLPTTPVPGVNLFFIVETEYDESSDPPTLTISTDNYVDSVQFQLTRLEALETADARSQSVTTPPIQAAGASFKMRWGWQGDAVTNGHTFGPQLAFPTIQSNAPSTIAFTQVFAPTNVTGGPSTNNVDQYGANAFVTANTGQTSFGYTASISGNCLLDVDAHHGLAHIHCDVCEIRAKRLHGCVGMVCERCYEAAVHRDLPFERLRIDRAFDRGGPGEIALAHDCARCGTTECYSPNMALHDEDEGHSSNHAARAAQVALIRRLQRALGHRVIEHCGNPDGCATCDAHQERPWKGGA